MPPGLPTTFNVYHFDFQGNVVPFEWNPVTVETVHDLLGGAVEFVALREVVIDDTVVPPLTEMQMITVYEELPRPFIASEISGALTAFSSDIVTGHSYFLGTTLIEAAATTPTGEQYLAESILAEFVGDIEAEYPDPLTREAGLNWPSLYETYGKAKAYPESGI